MQSQDGSQQLGPFFCWQRMNRCILLQPSVVRRSVRTQDTRRSRSNWLTDRKTGATGVSPVQHGGHWRHASGTHTTTPLRGCPESSLAVMDSTLFPSNKERHNADSGTEAVFDRRHRRTVADSRTVDSTFQAGWATAQADQTTQRVSPVSVPSCSVIDFPERH